MCKPIKGRCRQFLRHRLGAPYQSQHTWGRDHRIQCRTTSDSRCEHTRSTCTVPLREQSYHPLHHNRATTRDSPCRWNTHTRVRVPVRVRAPRKESSKVGPRKKQDPAGGKCRYGPYSFQKNLRRSRYRLQGEGEVCAHRESSTAGPHRKHNPTRNKCRCGPCSFHGNSRSSCGIDGSGGRDGGRRFLLLQGQLPRRKRTRKQRRCGRRS